MLVCIVTDANSGQRHLVDFSMFKKDRYLKRGDILEKGEDFLQLRE